MQRVRSFTLIITLVYTYGLVTSDLIHVARVLLRFLGKLQVNFTFLWRKRVRGAVFWLH